MNLTVRRAGLSLAALAFATVNPVTTPVSAVPVVVDTIVVGDTPRSVTFSPNGRKLYVANADENSVSVINAR